MKRFAKRLLRRTRVLEQMRGLVDRQTSYSQFGEDVHIASYYNRLAFDRGIVVRKGCIVDVGAFRPISMSNTYFFYKRGWRSINIDPTPGTKAIFDRVRPKDTNLEVSIAPQAGQGTFYLFGQPSVWNTMDEAAAREAEAKTGQAPQRITVTICRLDEILDHHLVQDSFEILTIDAEGYDVEILRSNDFARYSPRLILIEVHDLNLAELPNHPVVRYLEDRGYSLYSWINPNLLFVRSDSLLNVGKHAEPAL
ncbi:MAG: FkbM family methyltransferase [Rhizomicrobium sp.]